MNSMKLHDPGIICIHIILINYHKEKVNNPIYYYTEKNKIPRNKLNQGSERPVV